MKVACWNINGLRARMDFVVHWLKSRQPDVVGLQELKLEDDQFPRLEFEALGYHTLTHGQKAWNGVAVLSREPAEAIQRGLPGQGGMGARLLTARIGDLDFTTIYAPNGKSVSHDDYPLKLDWYDALAAHLRASQDSAQRSVLCGDFNICPAPIDSWNEEGMRGSIFHTDAERERFRKLLDCGLQDLFRLKYPDEKKFSWWDYRGGAFHRGQGLRIDFILGSAAAAAGLQDVEIDREYRKKKDDLTASDHAPVIATLG